MSSTSSVTKVLARDGSKLMGSYTLYVVQLMTTFIAERGRDDPNYVAIACQVAVFVSIILAREYKNKRTTVVDKEMQSEPDNDLRTPF